MQLTTENIVINEKNGLVTLAFEAPTHPDAAIRRLLSVFAEIPNPYAFDWLLDFRQVSPLPTRVHLERVAAKWETVAKGRDIGRRTAMLYGFKVAASVNFETRRLFPFRTVRSFDHIDAASAWIQSICCTEDAEALLV